MANNIEKEFLELAINRKMHTTEHNLKHHVEYIFENVNLEGKKVLDVGGGVGVLTFYAAVKGAAKAVCLEPEFDGSSAGVIAKFNAFKSSLSQDLPVEHRPVTIQSYLQSLDKNELFDVIVFHNSINHINEDACINLHKSKESYEFYKDLFKQVYDKMNKSGQLIIADCSSKNFYNAVGIKNFLAPTIEWHKHQPPHTWIKLLKEVGFKNAKVSWSSPNTFGSLGRTLLGNAVVAYFTYSHFKFIIEK